MKLPLIELAKSSSAHGIKGGAQVRLYNTQDSILSKGVEVLLKPASEASQLPSEGLQTSIENISFGNKTIIYFKGASDRTMIENWLPFTLSVSRSIFPRTEDGEFYLVDLIGLEVFNKKGKLVGKISGTFNHGSIDIVEIDLNNGGELSLPLKGNFFELIDIEARRVIINDVEYL